ncbi:MAG: SDR family oxidoreductase [Myxococcota bacterium]
MVETSSRTVLLTGSTGFLGGELLGRLVREPGTTVCCLIRAEGPAELERRRGQLLEWARIPETEAQRVVAVPGDVEASDLGLDAAYGSLADRVDEIFHAAASTRFDLPLERARRTNLEGTKSVLRFAREAQCRGGLSRLHHVSTSFVSGDRYGVLREEDAKGASRFRNSYEQSKWEAEQSLEEAQAELPITIYRPSIIVGDARTGRTLHFLGFYQPLQWVYTGKLPVVPCRPEVRVDVVPVDFVADAILAIGRNPASVGQAYHLTAGPEKSISIEEVAEIAVAATNAFHEETGQPPIEAPRIVTPEEIDGLPGGEQEGIRTLSRLASEYMRSHMPYMLREVLFDSTRSAALLEAEGIRCPSLADYLPVLIRYGLIHNPNL